MHSHNPDRLWYAIAVRSRYESTAAAALKGKGQETFLPVHRSVRRWSDRVKEIEEPLFPGYLFCRFDVNDRLLPILTTPGVISIIGAGKTPTSVPDSEIAAIQAVVRSGLAAEPWASLSAGTAVLIERGPLAGIEGTVLNAGSLPAAGKYKLIVSVELLGRSIAVDINPEWVRVPAPTPPVWQYREFPGAIRSLDS
jgi:transcription antitermination factor NusG